MKVSLKPVDTSQFHRQTCLLHYIFTSFNSHARFGFNSMFVRSTNIFIPVDGNSKWILIFFLQELDLCLLMSFKCILFLTISTHEHYEYTQHLIIILHPTQTNTSFNTALKFNFRCPYPALVSLYFNPSFNSIRNCQYFIKSSLYLLFFFALFLKLFSSYARFYFTVYILNIFKCRHTPVYNTADFK